MSRHVNSIVISGTKAFYLEKYVCRVNVICMHGMMYELKREVMTYNTKDGGEEFVCTSQVNENKQK